MRVKSAVDWWIAIILWGAIFIMCASVIFLPKDEKVLGISILFPVSVFIMWIYFYTYYELREKYLYIRCGPIFEKIPYERIKSINLSQNFLSSMALSFKRIEIRQHGKGYILGTTFISPVDREEFLTELQKRCNNLEPSIV